MTGNVLAGKTIALFTDGSKFERGTRAGFYCEELNIEHSLHLEDHATIFQAEVSAIARGAQELRLSNLTGERIAICSDSQAALKALERVANKYRVVSEYKHMLKELNRANNITLIWVPGHNNIPGNEKADELAKIGS